MNTSPRNHLGPVGSIDELDLFTKSGVVIDRQMESDTQVYGSVTNGHGRISSSTTDYLTLFLRKDDGDEFSVMLQDFAVQARVGNRVSLIFAGNTDSGSGWAAGFLNHDTGREAIRTGMIESLAPTRRRYQDRHPEITKTKNVQMLQGRQSQGSTPKPPTSKQYASPFISHGMADTIFMSLRAVKRDTKQFTTHCFTILCLHPMTL